jgi:hypothetical protein
MATPDILTLIDCQLPDNLERLLLDFQNEMLGEVKPYHDFLDDWVANELPTVQANLTSLIDASEGVLLGSPVDAMSSLDALDANLGLTNPRRDEFAPETVRIDERKFGASGLMLLFGRMFRIIPGQRIGDLRRLWEVVGGDYQAFVAAGNAIVSSPHGSYVFYEFNPLTRRFPYVNRSFQAVQDLTGYDLTLWHHRLFFNETIYTGLGNRLKLEANGFTETQITNIFAGRQPNQGFDYPGTLKQIANYCKSLGQFMVLDPSDPRRQPPWVTETGTISLAIKDFLAWRLARHTTSTVLTGAFWNTFLANFRPNEMKELFDNRPEIKDLELPVNQDNIIAVLQRAITMPRETTVINSYYLSLPPPDLEATSRDALFDLGLLIWNKITTELPAQAPGLADLLRRLTGTAVDGSTKTVNPVPTNITPADIRGILPASYTQAGNPLPKVPSTPIGILTSVIGQPMLLDPLTAVAIKTDVELNRQADQSTPTTGNPDEGEDKQAGTAATQGLPSEETFSTLGGRRIKWAANFIDPGIACSTSAQNQDSAIGDDPAQVARGKAQSHQDTKILDGNPDAPAARDRKVIEQAQSTKPGTKLAGQFEISCVQTAGPGGALGKLFDDVAKLQRHVSDVLLQLIKLIKGVILFIQDLIDSFILKFQLALDSALGTLERILTIDINLGGKAAFENSIIRCAWSIDLALKFDPVAFLLSLLGDLFDGIGVELTKILNKFREFIDKIFCKILNFLEQIIDGATAQLRIGLAKIGCTLKDFQLPPELLDLLRLFNASLNIRSIVLKAGSEDWLDMSLKLKKLRDEFNPLAQFAQFCSTKSTAKMLGAMKTQVALSTSDLPFKGNNAADKAALAEMMKPAP